MSTTSAITDTDGPACKKQGGQEGNCPTNIWKEWKSMSNRITGLHLLFIECLERKPSIKNRIGKLESQKCPGNNEVQNETITQTSIVESHGRILILKNNLTRIKLQLDNNRCFDKDISAHFIQNEMTYQIDES